MAAITGTLVRRTEHAGEWKHFCVSFVPGSASDTIDVSALCSEISHIVGPPHITAGNDAALQNASATFSGTTITILTWAGAGTVATDWTGATGQVCFMGR